MNILKIINNALPHHILGAALGVFISLISVMYISQLSIGLHTAPLLVASMGASAMLIFMSPHSPLSQPWPIIGGHTLAALIGVTCSHWIHDPLLAAALAPTLSMLGMQPLKCLHPPAGATALSAVLGGQLVQQLGYAYVLTPVLLNAISLILIGILMHYPFAKRRYPLLLSAAPVKTV